MFHLNYKSKENEHAVVVSIFFSLNSSFLENEQNLLTIIAIKTLMTKGQTEILNSFVLICFGVPPFTNYTKIIICWCCWCVRVCSSVMNGVGRCCRLFVCSQIACIWWWRIFMHCRFGATLSEPVMLLLFLYLLNLLNFTVALCCVMFIFQRQFNGSCNLIWFTALHQCLSFCLLN